jgi:hypothetical protein
VDFKEKRMETVSNLVVDKEGTWLWFCPVCIMVGETVTGSQEEFSRRASITHRRAAPHCPGVSVSIMAFSREKIEPRDVVVHKPLANGVLAGHQG